MAVSAAPPRTRRLIFALAKLLVSGGLIGFLIYHHAPNFNQLANVDVPFCLLTIMLFASQVVINAVRWRIILEHVSNRAPPLGQIFLVYYASVFFTQILPSIGGDLVRVMYHRTLGSPIGLMIVSVLIERGLGLGALLILALAFIPLLDQLDPPRFTVLLVAAVAGGGLAVAYGGCAILSWLRGRQVWRRLPQGAQTLISAISWSLTSRTGLSRLIPLSLIVHLLSIMCIYLIARAVQVPLTPAAALATGPILLLAQMLPISIGGWGVRESAAVVLFGLAGVDAGSSFLVAVLFGILVTVASLPGAFAWLLVRE